ncbi:MAG: exo-alpha-sialidase [Ignavibacteria bacterium]|nr:exo-alpha-sialidase [Ignavibacteria bacterium]
MNKNIKKILPVFISLTIFGAGFIYLNLSKNKLSEPEVQMSPRNFLYKEKFGEVSEYAGKDISTSGNVTNIRLNQSPGVSEPLIKCSPIDKNILAVCANDFTVDNNNARLFISRNKGRDWDAQLIPLSPLFKASSYSDPWLEYDNTGNLYFTAVQYDLYDNKRDGLFFAKSADNGITWNSELKLIAVNRTLQYKIDKPKVFVNRSNVVFVIWTEVSGLKSFIKISLSRDNGGTFSEPVIVSDDRAHFSAMTEDNNGILYLTYINDGKSISAVKSNDEGRSWTAIEKNLEIKTAGKPAGNRNVLKSNSAEGIRINSEPSLCISKENEVLIAYTAKKNDSDLSDIYLTKLIKNNSEFDVPKKMSNDTSGNDQYLPVITSDEAGNVYVFYQDSRNDVNNEFSESFIAVSSDGCKTFTDHLISTAPYKPSDIAVDRYFGDYNSLVISGKDLIAVWTDGRNGNYDLYAGIMNIDNLFSR